jgi:membrane protease YdiL (CAAX protease family)
MNEEEHSPGKQILLLTFLVFGMYYTSSLFYALCLAIFTTIPLESIDFNLPIYAYTSSFVSLIFMFGISFIIFLKVTNQSFRKLILMNKLKLKYIALAIGILVGSLFVMEILAALNMGLLEYIPSIDFESKALELEAAQQMWFDHDSYVNLFFSLLVFAVTPAVFEELVFRGVLLTKLKEASNNMHFSVVISAVIFAALHLQPWNLLPMIGMGVILGYVYVYLKDIRYSMLIHFLFNAIQIVVIFYYPEALSEI